jgi:hypothetical protein
MSDAQHPRTQDGRNGWADQLTRVGPGPVTTNLAEMNDGTPRRITARAAELSRT